MNTLLARTISVLALLPATLAAPEAAAQSTLQAGDSVRITWYGRSSVYQVVPARHWPSATSVRTLRLWV